MTQIQSVKLSKLALSPINVRKPGNDLIEQFASDLFARGVLQNLIVAPVKKRRGTYEVIAGSRRYRALMLLAKRGDIKAVDYDVPVLVIDADEATLSETSLAENFQHLAMSPADECRAFQHFIGQDGDIDGVAARFGLTRRFVEGRLRLASLAAPIFEALEQGKIGFELAKAYASTESHERQLLIWNSYGSYSHYGADSIKRLIANESMKSNEPVALLVGADAYVSAGGRIDRDLFTENADRWENPEIAEKLAAEMLTAEAQRLGTEMGLAWVRPLASPNTWELARDLHVVHLPRVPMTSEQTARLDEVSSRMAELEETLRDENLAEDVFAALDAEYDALNEERTGLHDRPKILPDKLKPLVGMILCLTRAGEMKLEDQYYSETPLRITAITEDPQASAPADGEEDAHGGSDVDGGQPTDAEGATRPVTGWKIEAQPEAAKPERAPTEPGGAAPDGKPISQVLFDQLAVQRRDVLSAALLANPSLALDYLLFVMIDGRGFDVGGRSGSTIAASRASDPGPADSVPASRAREYLEEYAAALEDGWKDAGSKVARLEAFRTLSDDAKAQWLAWTVATSLEAKDGDGARKQNALQNRLATILEVDVASWWRPTAANYFDRVSKGSTLKLLDDVGGPAISARHASQKKGDIAASCEKLFAGEAIVEAEVKEAAIAWVPDAMKFLDTLDAPVAANPKADEADIDSDDMDLTLNDDAAPDEDDDPGVPIGDKDSFESEREADDDFGINDEYAAIAAE